MAFTKQLISEAQIKNNQQQCISVNILRDLCIKYNVQYSILYCTILIVFQQIYCTIDVLYISSFLKVK